MKVVIVGCAARSIQWPEDAEVWVINHAAQMYQGRWHRWFHLHGPEHAEWAGNRSPYGQDARAMAQVYWGDPTERPRTRWVYVPDPEAWARFYRPDPGEPGIKTDDLLRFPYGAIRAKYGDYLNNSIPLLLVSALECGATEVWLDGVMYGRDQPAEAWAVPCIEHWIGYLRGAGVTVHVPTGSGLCEWSHVYGLEGPGSV